MSKTKAKNHTNSNIQDRVLLLKLLLENVEATLKRVKNSNNYKKCFYNTLLDQKIDLTMELLKDRLSLRGKYVDLESTISYNHNNDVIVFGPAKGKYKSSH